MGKLFNIIEYERLFEEYIKNPPIAILDDINKMIQIRQGFLAGLPFFSEKIPYDFHKGERWDHLTSSE